MAWPNGTRYKSYIAGDAFPPADINGIQDQILQVAGYRGKCLIPAEQTRSDAAFGLLTTPDQVTVTAGAESLLLVKYSAIWKSTDSSSSGKAALFLNETRLTGTGDDGPFYLEATTGGSTSWAILSTDHGGSGLIPGSNGPVNAARGAGPTVFGDFAVIEIPDAGAYTVSVRFQTTGGQTVSVKDRKLWVATMRFD